MDEEEEHDNDDKVEDGVDDDCSCRKSCPFSYFCISKDDSENFATISCPDISQFVIFETSTNLVKSVFFFSMR